MKCIITGFEVALMTLYHAYHFHRHQLTLVADALVKAWLISRSVNRGFYKIPSLQDKHCRNTIK